MTLKNKLIALLFGITFAPCMTLAQTDSNRGNQLKGHEAFVAGGRENRAFGAETFIGGGYKNTADGDLSVIVAGQFNRTRAKYSTIGGGYVNEVKGQYATIPGGWWLKAPSFGEVAVGYLNTVYAPFSSNSPHPKDRIFVVGNGNTEVVTAIETKQNRSDAFYLLKSGDAMLSGRLFQSADTMDHAFSTALEPSMVDFRNIEVLQFKWDGTSSFRNRYDLNFGFNASSVKSRYPNLVSVDGLGHATVDYIGFIPLLVEDAKQKEEKIRELEDEKDMQAKQIDMLQDGMNFLIDELSEMKAELARLKSVINENLPEEGKEEEK